MHLCFNMQDFPPPDVASVSIVPQQTPFGLYILTVPPHVLASLQWWKDPRSVMMGVPFATLQPSVALISDISDLGWGANHNNLRTQGLRPQELSLHINVTDLRAVRVACQVFLPQISGKVVQVLTDNTMAMFYINKQGGA